MRVEAWEDKQGMLHKTEAGANRADKHAVYQDAFKDVLDPEREWYHWSHAKALERVINNLVATGWELVNTKEKTCE